MRNSFKIFSLFIGLLVILIILRLNSISYPRDIEDNTEVIYLEEFHDYGSLFDIEYKNFRFRLKPRINNIEVKGIPAVKTVNIGDSDLIIVGNRKFLFNIFPRAAKYRRIVSRPVEEIFKSSSKPKFIGGWTIADRKQVLAQEKNHPLLRNLLVEIAAGKLKQLIPNEETFDGKLLELRLQSALCLEIKSPLLQVTRIRDWQEEQVKENTIFTTRNGDILKLPYRESNDALFLKFNLVRVRGVDYLSISYKEKILPSPAQEPGQEIAFLRSLDTGVSYSINKNRKNAFIGSKALFSFNLTPGKLMDKLYIPDKIPEGGQVDIKELLDRRMYYRKGNSYYPVTGEFIYELKNTFREKNSKEILRYFEENKIVWRDFKNDKEFKNFSKAAQPFIRKMENKGIFQTFSREIERLNKDHYIRGIGLGVDNQVIEKVSYKSGGHSWLNASRVRANTPIISGIDTFFWGAQIKDTDEPVLFRIEFKQTPPSPSRLIAAADYRFSPGKENFNHKGTEKNFFDGPQTFTLPKGKKEIYLKVWNIKRFNKTNNSTNFQAEITLETPGGKRINLETDHTWQGSIDTFHWSPVQVNPPYSLPDPAASQLDSLWYFEKWNPVYRGIKFRYFRKKFELEDLPQKVTWQIFACGNYLLRVNRQAVNTGKDFIEALKVGKNTLTVMISRKGYRKNFYVSPLLKVKNDRILLKQKQVQRASFKRTKTIQKPIVTDVNNSITAYSSGINGRSQRFYTPGAQSEILSVMGSPADGIWGLEQVFSRLYEENKIAAIRLTIDSEWQRIALDAVKKILQKNREEELKKSEYKMLKKELNISETQLQEKRGELSSSSEVARQQIMQTIIQLQDKIAEIRKKLDKIKNPFYEAAVILMNPKGEILTAASYPYNEKTMVDLNPQISKPYRPGENPYLNRSWKWRYNPGSTAKILTAVSFLDSVKTAKKTFPYLYNLLRKGESFKDFPRANLRGAKMLNGKEIYFKLKNFLNYTMAPGFCSLHEALAKSHNTYFAYLALHNNRMLTVDSIVHTKKREFVSKANIPVTQTYKEYPPLKFAESLLLNKRVDLLDNLKGSELWSKLRRLPNDAFVSVESIFPVNAYTPGNIAHYAIGQGDFQLTALQNALIASTILNRGYLYYPSIIKSVRFKDPDNKPGEWLHPDPGKHKRKVFASSYADQIKAAMKEVVLTGSADTVFKEMREGRVFYVKTGTAETKFYKDNSLFVGFVQFRDKSHIIFSVIVPRSGIGAKVAGKLTETIIKEIILHEEKKKKKRIL